MTPLISAETGEGAAGCASGSQTCSGSRPALAPKPNSASRNAIERPRAGQHDRAHRAERVVAAAALQHAEAEQDRDRADVRDQQVEESRAADLRNAVIGRHQEERRERHRLPRDHEDVGVVGDQHQRHRGEKDVVLQAQQSRRGAFARAEVAGGEDRDPGATPRRAAAGRTPTASRGAGGTAGPAGRAAGPSTAAAGRSRRTRRSPDRAPTSAPAGNRMRLTKRRSRGRTRPSTPIASHAAIAAMTS